MSYAYQVIVKLFSYRSPIALSIRNKYIGITAVHAETEHPSNSLCQSALRTFCSTIILKSLDRNCRSWRFFAARIEGYWKKNRGVWPLFKIFSNEEIARVREFLAIKHDYQEVVP